VSCPLPAPARTGLRRGSALRFAAALAALTFGGPSFRAAAQMRPYYNITEITATQLNNAVILTIRGDGAMTDVHTHDWMVTSDGSPIPVEAIELHCSNAKSQVGDFVDVSKYPISHVELQPRSFANDGIGLTVFVKLYAEARVRHFRTERFSGDWHWNPEMGCCFSGELGRDQQSFVLTVISDRFAKQEAAPVAPATQQLELEPGPRDTYSLWALNVDLQRLAHELGKQTGTRIVVDESVRRYVTVHLPDMPVRELLAGVAAGYGLALEERDGQYVLSKGMATNVATYDTNVTQVVKLEHLAPTDALNLLPNFLLAYIEPSEAQNALIVAGPEPLVRRVREDVAKIDHPPQQVRIEITAVKVAGARAWRQEFAGELAQGTTSLTVDPQAGSLTYGRLDESADEVRARLRRLEQQGVVNTLARAHVTLVNGRWASLFLGETQYIQVTRNSEYGDDQIAIPVELGVDVGLIAWTGGGGIAMWLMPTVTALGGVDPATDLPIVDRYETTGALIVPDGHTLLLGGVRLTGRSDLVRRIAGLGVRGGAGLVPPDRATAVDDAEIAIFLTARELGEFDASDQPAYTVRMARELEAEGLELKYRPLDGPPPAGG